MANYILFDGDCRENLLPLTFTRPSSEIRCGILTIREKWEKFLKTKVSYLTEDYLKDRFPLVVSEDNYFIMGNVFPNLALYGAILQLQFGEALVYNDKILATRLKSIDDFESLSFHNVKKYEDEIHSIDFAQDIFRHNGREIEADWKLLTHGRTSAKWSDTNRVLQPERIFVEEGAKLEFSILNPANGFIYIGKDAEIMEGSVVHGSLALCDHSVLKLSTKIYGPTTIGPCSKVGGEVNNSVIFGYSNKAHDGFLGNSVLGEWCNLGADTNNSNLKNNYAEVKLWSYPKQSFIKTGLQFCGLVMGDHSKCGINTMFNTGTVVGVSCNIFGSGFPRNFVPDFSWGGAAGFAEYKIKEVQQVARMVMTRREMPENYINQEMEILTNVFSQTEKSRQNY